VTLEFQPWPKIARLNRRMVITEKIDGTNAAVIITEDGEVGAQSRNRLLTPESDNFGFARWVQENAETLSRLLGPGRHFGEWWGSGIQRAYGLKGVGGKRFSLFNVARYGEVDFSEIPNVSTVPVLYEGLFSEYVIRAELDHLEREGSVAQPGFGNPEGIVIFHEASRQMFKVTIKGDEAPKGQVG